MNLELMIEDFIAKARAMGYELSYHLTLNQNGEVTHIDFNVEGRID